MLKKCIAVFCCKCLPFFYTNESFVAPHLVGTVEVPIYNQTSRILIIRQRNLLASCLIFTCSSAAADGGGVRGLTVTLQSVGEVQASDYSAPSSIREREGGGGSSACSAPVSHAPPAAADGTPASLQDSLRCCGCGTTPSVLSLCAMLVTLWYLYLAARTVAEKCKYFCCCCAV